MSHDIYIFGSLCRGESSPTSDVDVLVIPFSAKRSLFPDNWSIYTPELIAEYFQKGRLFAWHLHLEAKCIFTTKAQPFLAGLNSPAPYSTMMSDIDDLEALLLEAVNELNNGTRNIVYELGIAYTALRDLAMSASWSLMGAPCFSCDAPYRLPVDFPLKKSTYRQAMLARHSSTRGIELGFDPQETATAITQAPFEQWVMSLREAK